MRDDGPASSDSPEQRIERIRLAGMLHDVGKVSVPDSILNKPGKLTDEEYPDDHDDIRSSARRSSSIRASPTARLGRGASRAPGRSRISARRSPASCVPLEARILAVADAYEAMTSDRAYRSSIGPAAAREELERCTGTQFDAPVVDALLSVLEREAERAETALTRL